MNCTIIIIRGVAVTPSSQSINEQGLHTFNAAATKCDCHVILSCSATMADQFIQARVCAFGSKYCRSGLFN